MDPFTGVKVSLRKKLMVLYLLAAVLPIFLIMVIIGRFNYHTVLQSVYELLQQNQQMNEKLVLERIGSCENALYEMVVDQEYLELSRKISQGNENDSFVAKNALRSVIQGNIYAYPAIRSVTFLTSNGGYVNYSKWYGSLYDSIWSDTQKRNEIFQMFTGEERIKRVATVNLRNDGFGTDNVILLGIPIRNLYSKQEYGVFIVAVDNSVLTIDYGFADWKKSAITTVIADESDKILAGAEDQYINKDVSYYLSNSFDDVKTIERMERPIGNLGWKIVALIQKNVYQQEILTMVIPVLLVIGVITIIFSIVVVIYSNNYIRKIQSIADGIRHYGEEPEQEIEILLDEKDDLYLIVRQFRTMTDEIRGLIDELQQKNVDIQKASKRQKHAEIKALEAQINPHFLYNTLDSINWRAIENDEEEISNMLTTLGSLLRYSISQIDMLVMMEAELGWLKKYIFLQRDRFNNSFDIEYDVTDDVLDFPIYKMLLQPIIENAIVHAFEDVHEGGMIYFKARILEDGRLWISIRDNGAGMSSKTLQEIWREIREKDSLNSKSIGISNIINRLWIYYQDKAEIYVDSKEGKGTEFILIIPEIKDGEYIE